MHQILLQQTKVTTKQGFKSYWSYWLVFHI